MKLQFRKLDPMAKVPFYATSGSAGMDIRALEGFQIEPGQVKMVRTGLSVAVPEGYELQVRSRSGQAARRGLAVVNSPGTIDSDYRGEIWVILTVLASSEDLFARGLTCPIIIEADERIAQLVLKKVERLPIVEVETLDETERGEGGIGSTGVK
jgi:dUTP pyrophosphatase